MFWREPFDYEAALDSCNSSWGVTPHSKIWAVTEWGGRRIQAGSNIVFTNGLLDPWHGGGVLESLSDSLVAVVIPEVGGGGGGYEQHSQGGPVHPDIDV
jgi:hypothetical protein